MATRRQVRPAPADAWGPLPPHAARLGPSPIRRAAARALFVVGIACTGYYGYVSAEALLYQAYENRELEAILRAREPASSPTDATPASMASRPRRAGRPGSTVGRIEIPRLRVSAVIKAGADARTLQLAVGHIPGTAFPGERGNVGLAGHRDTFFRRLRDVKADDEIRITTAEGSFSYRVERTKVVEPRDVWVLDPTEFPSLTLVTCYPFSYVGSAPQRFVVRAQLVPQAAGTP